METFSEVFSKLTDKHNFSDAEIARRLGVNRSTIGRWKSGEQSPKLSKLKEIADIFGVDTLVFVDEELRSLELRRPEPRANQQRKINTITKPILPKNAIRVTGQSSRVPLYGSIAAGIPLEMVQIEDTIEIPTHVSERYPNAFLLKVSGDSMNKIVPRDMYALIDPCEEVQNGEVAAIAVNGSEATLKRFYRLANSVVLEPDSWNPDHYPQAYDCTKGECSEIKIIGKMVWIMPPFDVKY